MTSHMTSRQQRSLSSNASSDIGSSLSSREDSRLSDGGSLPRYIDLVGSSRNGDRNRDRMSDNSSNSSDTGSRNRTSGFVADEERARDRKTELVFQALSNDVRRRRQDVGNSEPEVVVSRSTNADRRAPKKRVNEYNEEPLAVVSSSSSSKNSGGGVGHTSVRHHQTAVSTTFRAYSNLAMACSSDEDYDADTDFRRNLVGDERRLPTATEDLGDVYRKPESRSTGSSIADDSNIDEQNRQLVKFLSMPNIDLLRPARQRWQLVGEDGQHPAALRIMKYRRRRDARDLAWAEVDDSAATSSRGSDDLIESSDRPSSNSPPSRSTGTRASVSSIVDAERRTGADWVGGRSMALMAESMPCISTTSRAARRGGRKRYLPSLGVTDEAVEQKLSTLTRQLSLRYLQIHGQDGGLVTNDNNKLSASSIEAITSGTSFIRLTAPKKIRTSSHRVAMTQDDDTMSMTSQEVAEILSAAAPMAPLTDDEDADDDIEDGEEEENYDDVHEESGDYDNDDGPDPRHQQAASTFQQRLSVDEHGIQSHLTAGGDAGVHSTTELRVGRRADDALSSLERKRLTNGLVEDGGHRHHTKREQVETDDSMRRRGDVEAPVSLFRLVETCRVLTARLERNLVERRGVLGSEADRRRLLFESSPPIQVANHALSLTDKFSASGEFPRRTLSAVIVTHVNKYTWSVTSQGDVVRPGDIIIEVNGQFVLGQSALDVNSLLLSIHRSVTSSTLDLVFARRRH